MNGFQYVLQTENKILNLLEYIGSSRAYAKLGFELKGFWIKIILN